MPRERKIHKLVRVKGQYPGLECGSSSCWGNVAGTAGVRHSDGWRDVTCKHCLRHYAADNFLGAPAPDEGMTVGELVLKLLEEGARGSAEAWEAPVKIVDGSTKERAISLISFGDDGVGQEEVYIELEEE